MRDGRMARSLLAATVVFLGAAAVPATARAGLLSDILTPVIDLLGDGGSVAGNSGPGNAEDQLPDPPPPTAPPPPMTPAAPTPVAPTAPTEPAAPTEPGASKEPGAPAAPAVPTAPAAPATPASPAAAPPLPPARPTSPVSLRYLVGRHLLRPAPGTVVAGLRPTLRWRGGPARVDLYNVQIFTATGAKLMSAFPRSRAFRIPPKRLGPGRRYVWRVWPYRRTHGYTRKPLGLSWFATPSRTVLSQRAG
jgi:hypothetical protein